MFDFSLSVDISAINEYFHRILNLKKLAQFQKKLLVTYTKHNAEP